MMIYFHKILPFALSPLVLCMALIVYGLLKRKRGYGLVGVLLLYASSTFVVADYLFEKVEGTGLKTQAQAAGKADGIVVLSGMMHGVHGAQGTMQEWDDADRFFAGVDLYQAGKSSRLVFTGGRVPWQRAVTVEGDILKQFAERLGVPESAMTVSSEVTNTAQEAKVVRKMFAETRPKILLVTSAFHMKRAKELFEKEGFVVEAFPVDFKVKAKTLTLMDFFPDPRALRMTDIVVRECLGRLYYQVRSL